MLLIEIALIISMPQNHLKKVLKRYSIAQSDSIYFLGDANTAIVTHTSGKDVLL